jgi:hypothetical protein
MMVRFGLFVTLEASHDVRALRTGPRHRFIALELPRTSAPRAIPSWRTSAPGNLCGELIVSSSSASRSTAQRAK